MIETEEEKLFRIKRYQRKFQEGIPFEQKLKYLKYLQEVDMSLDILKRTSIGKTVSILRKENGIIGDKASELVAKWKNVVTSQQNEENMLTKRKQCADSEEKSPTSLNAELSGHDKKSSNSTQNMSSLHVPQEDMSMNSKVMKTEDLLTENGKIKEYKKLMSSEYINRSGDIDKEEKPSRVISDTYDSGVNNSKMLDETCMVPMLPTTKKKTEQVGIDESAVATSLFKKLDHQEGEESYVDGSMFQKSKKKKSDDSYVAGSISQKGKQKESESSYTAGSLFQKRKFPLTPTKDDKKIKGKHSESHSTKTNSMEEKESNINKDQGKISEKSSDSYLLKNDRAREKEADQKTEKKLVTHAASFPAKKEKDREKEHNNKTEVSELEDKPNKNKNDKDAEDCHLNENEKQNTSSDMETPKKKTKSFEEMLLMPMIAAAKTKKKKKTTDSKSEGKRKTPIGDCCTSGSSSSSSSKNKIYVSKSESNVKKLSPESKTDSNSKSDGKKKSGGQKSFEDMLMMPMLPTSKKKKSEKIKKSIDESLSTLPEVDLPQIDTTPVYRPIRAPPSPPSATTRCAPTPTTVEKTPTIPLTIRDEDITSRRTKSVMYSGRKQQSNGVVHSLYQMCMKVLIENVDSLYETGGVPYSVLEPMLVKCSPAQLERLEYYNPHFIADTDRLWRKHCLQTFKTQKIDEDSVGAWRDTYKDLLVEREEKLKRLSAKISVNQATKTPERSTKLAFMARAPKPSAQIARAQKRFGTGNEKSDEKEREMEREKEREKERRRKEKGKYVDSKQHSKPKPKTDDSVSEASSSDDAKDSDEDQKTQNDIRKRMMEEQEESSEVFVPFGNVPRSDRCSGKRPPTSLTSSAANQHPPSKKQKTSEELGSVAPPQFTPVKKKKAKNPMMLKTMQMLKKQKGRLNSSIMRR